MKKILLCADPGRNLGLVTLSSGVLRGRTHTLKGRGVVAIYNEVSDLLCDIPHRANYTCAILSTEFVGQSNKGSLTFVATKTAIHLAMCHVFGEVTELLDIDARVAVWPDERWRKGSKEQAQALLERDYDLSKLDRRPKAGDIAGDTLDACVGVLGFKKLGGGK